MTNEQIEAVAKELAFDRCSNAWENMEELWREVCRTEARRVIKAYEAAKATAYVPADPYGAAYDREHLT